MVDGQPIAGSFGSALAANYFAGARAAELQFSSKPGPLQPDLIFTQECLQWCDHVTVVYPNWWGTYPAIFKAFLDRLL